jgi:hypothetical protein
MSFERIRRMMNKKDSEQKIIQAINDDPQKDLPLLYRGLTCCLQGGMGNQMFQYAMARSFAKKFDCQLYLNINRFNECNMRQYSLGLWRGVNETFTINEPNRIIERGLPYNPQLANLIKRGSSLIGYWQTEKYFKDIKDDLQEIFMPKQPMTERGLETLRKIQQAGSRSVFLTIRRTDYVSSDFHNVLSREYYENALRVIADEVGDPVVFVFSDEPEWCQENMDWGYEMNVAGNYDMTIKTHLGREDEELFLMMNCKHAILANSSYSWWGAWLGRDPGMRIAPKKWFMADNADPRDIVPENWIRL